MKTVVIVSHPEIQQSSSQQFFLAALEGEDVEVHHLDAALENGHFNVAKERAMLSEARRIIFQFPLYWYQVPAVMKQWMDEVFTEKLLQSKKELGVVVTIGAQREYYQPGRRVGFSVVELLRPLQALAHYVGWAFEPPFEVYQFDYLTEIEKQRLLVDYLYYIEGGHHGLTDRENWMKNKAITFQRPMWQTIAQWIEEQQENRLELEFLLQEMEDNE